MFFLLVSTSVLAQDNYQPRNTQKPGEEPPTPQKAADAITVPDGFQVRLFAGEPEVRQPVAMALDDRGRLWVAESYSYKEWKKTGEDRIIILEDTDNDGRHDKRTIFTGGIDHLSGMTVGWGGVWVCSSPNLLFYPDKNRDDIPDGEPEIVLDGWTTNAKHNFFNGLTWGPDGWLYGRHGITAPSKVGAPGTPDDKRVEFDCSIWRYHPVTKKFEIVCRGTTNPWGLDWNAAGDMFFSNNVNGHLWHGITGAFYPRMGDREDPVAKFVYDRIPMCADHLHHAGSINDWTKTRDGKGVHGKLGGGHSHCGLMIYQGAKWPKQYHGKAFIPNTHGRRVNVDRLDQEGPTYAARHENDFLFANNPWFRGVQIMYGPDGDVYLSDWTDLGECHDSDGVHRTSGRIYKIIYGDPSPPMKEKLWTMNEVDLVSLKNHQNQWYVRQSQHILQMRAATRGDYKEAPAPNISAEIVAAESEPGQIRKYASQLGTLPTKEKWAVAGALLKQNRKIKSELLQLLIYYGIKDIAGSNPDQSLELLRVAADSNLLFTDNLSRNLAENGVFFPLISILDSSTNDPTSLAVLSGFADGIKGRDNLKAPKGWKKIFDTRISNAHMQRDILRINVGFDKAASKEKILDLLGLGSSLEGKLQALEILADMPSLDLHLSILPLINDPRLSAAAIPVLAKSTDTKIAKLLIAKYPDLPTESKALAINALAGNPKFANLLLDSLVSKIIPRSAVTAYHARQIQTFKDKALKKRLAIIWGRTGSSSSEKKKQIKAWQDQLTPDIVAKADTKNGHTKFQQLCMVCHTLHNEGGKIGPELTGTNRKDLFYLLENIIDPSATLPADFRLTILTKKDGAVISGNIIGENEYSVTLRTLTNEQVVQLDDIAKRETLNKSIMPEGLLTNLSADDVRDLIGFLGL